MSNSPGFRRRHYPLQGRSPTAIYHSDVNAEWQVDNQPLILKNVQATRAKIVNVFTVLLGEEHHASEFGSLIQLRLMEGITTRIAALIRVDTIIALREQLSDEISLLANECAVRELTENEGGDGYAVDIVYAPKPNGPVDRFTHSLRRAALGLPNRTLR